MASNTNTAKGRVRVTYVEEASVVKALEKLAKETGLTVSVLLRQAAWDYVKSCQSRDGAPVKRDSGRGK